MAKYEVTVALTGTDGNVFGLIGATKRAIRQAVGTAEADAFAKEAMSQESYDDVLRLIMETVEVE